MTLENTVIGIISRVIKTPASQLTVLSGLDLVNGWDSLNHTILVIELENEFDISFDFDELDKIITVDAIIHSLTAKGVTS
jgi:acyl carrier protein